MGQSISMHSPGKLNSDQTLASMYRLCRISVRLAGLAVLKYTVYVKTLTIRLPAPLVAEIEAESHGRQCTKSDIVRERLQRAAPPRRNKSTLLDSIADLIGSVDGLPANLSGQRNRYLKATGYGQKRPS